MIKGINNSNGDKIMINKCTANGVSFINIPIEKHFGCGVCGNTFIDIDAFGRHMQIEHDINIMGTEYLVLKND